MNFLKNHWTDWLQNLIPPDQQTNETVWCWYAAHILYYMKMFMLLKDMYWVKKTNLAPTVQFFEYPEKLTFHNENDVIIFSE